MVSFTDDCANACLVDPARLAMPWHPNSMRRLTIPAAIRSATADELAAITSPEADRERALRRTEAACAHTRTSPIGRSAMRSCRDCGSQWWPPVPGGPASPMGRSTPPGGGRRWEDRAEWEAETVRKPPGAK